ncbi:MAG: HAMP domain-containing histidine kinase [Actinomycetota bacterium]|nr:HAMP domain-containing histidine kinase [Actinomycetota bacterium]
MIAAAGWIAALMLAVSLLRLRSVLAGRMELVARACHELRGPITVARLGVEFVTRDRDLRGETLKAIDLELTSAGLALEDLSAALVGGHGPWRVDAVDVTALLAESFEAFRPLARARGVELDLRWRGEHQVVPADRIRLAQATGNLIANAIEHGQGRVELRGATREDRIEIEVADAGHGLPAPMADLITRRRSGRGHRGRGLAIAAEVAKRHGGHLTAQADDTGSSVSLFLPLQRS